MKLKELLIPMLTSAILFTIVGLVGLETISTDQITTLLLSGAIVSLGMSACVLLVFVVIAIIALIIGGITALLVDLDTGKGLAVLITLGGIFIIILGSYFYYPTLILNVLPSYFNWFPEFTRSQAIWYAVINFVIGMLTLVNSNSKDK